MPKVDQNLCIGCGMCENICPEAFELSDASKAAVKQNIPAKSKCVQEAADSCPSQAISK
ncbi:ferredoxin [Candidatus Parcubacteria bacterium]|nr:ferredoxin [Candidatus Parcubacteria bacterium]